MFNRIAIESGVMTFWVVCCAYIAPICTQLSSDQCKTIRTIVSNRGFLLFLICKGLWGTNVLMLIGAIFQYKYGVVLQYYAVIQTKQWLNVGSCSRFVFLLVFRAIIVQAQSYKNLVAWKWPC